MGHDRHTRVVSWLPLYHDMGLIGMLMIPMTTGTELVLAGPQDFLAAPARWAQWISDFHGSITAGPNFSYALATRALKRAGDLDLSRWRVCLNGAEPTGTRLKGKNFNVGNDPQCETCALGPLETRSSDDG